MGDKSLPPTETGGRALFFMMMTFQRNGFQILEKDTPECRRCMYLSEGERKDAQL